MVSIWTPGSTQGFKNEARGDPNLEKERICGRRPAEVGRAKCSSAAFSHFIFFCRFWKRKDALTGAELWNARGHREGGEGKTLRVLQSSAEFFQVFFRCGIFFIF